MSIDAGKRSDAVPNAKEVTVRTHEVRLTRMTARSPRFNQILKGKTLSSHAQMTNVNPSSCSTKTTIKDQSRDLLIINDEAPRNNLDLLEAKSTSATPIETMKAADHDPIAVAHANIAAGRADDINLLIKKIILNSNATSDKALFTIATGIFRGANFTLHAHKNDLLIEVKDANLTAKQLVQNNETALKEILAAREINLREVRFLS